MKTQIQIYLFIGFISFFFSAINAQTISPGAWQTEEYLPILKGKKIAIVANQTSTIDNVHLVDSLISLNFEIKKIFCPEHGFRGKSDAGEKIDNSKDKKTGLPIISLYGKNKTLPVRHLKDIDLVIFDIQDVGARFYTYISTLHYVMNSCAIKNTPLIVLDRPNPHGYYVDGPVLDTAFRSFVGMHPVPVVHGLTIGEYAKMINGEGWLENSKKCDLTVIKIKNYSHNSTYNLPIPPSPNLPNMTSIYLYPSLCFFEGTVMSIGRGTDKPFQMIGHPQCVFGSFIFKPKSIEGAKNPKYKDQNCFGSFFSENVSNIIKSKKILFIDYVVNYYKDMSRILGEGNYFNPFFDKLAGTDKLRKQIIAGDSVDKIRKSWQKDLEKFKITRKKYLLYEDFE